MIKLDLIYDKNFFHYHPGKAKPDEFKPFQMRDNLNKTKFTETSQVVQKSTFTTEESAGTKTTTTRYEATTSSIENGTNLKL